jgi:hypothetical protein
MNCNRLAICTASVFAAATLWCSAAYALPPWIDLDGESCASRFDVITIERLVQLGLPEDVDPDAELAVTLTCAESSSDVMVALAHRMGTFGVQRTISDFGENNASAERELATFINEMVSDWLSSWDRRAAASRAAARAARDATLLSRGVAANPTDTPTRPSPGTRTSRAGWYAELVPAASTMASDIRSGISVNALHRSASLVGYGFGLEWVSGTFDTTIGSLATRRISADLHVAFSLTSELSAWYVDPALGVRGGVIWSDSTSFDDFYGDRTSVLGWVSPFARFGVGRRVAGPVWLGVHLEGGYPLRGGVIDAVDTTFDFTLPWASAGAALRVGPF